MNWGRRMMYSSSSSKYKEKVECVVIGAGVVGLAIARELVNKGSNLVVVDRAPTFGTGISSRNSQVIHAGLYYPPNSLKARFCVRGKEMLYNYCKEREIQHKKIGKLVVATGPAQLPKLNSLMERGLQNGVAGLTMLKGFEAKTLEPHLQCLQALYSSSSGIVDAHGFMASLEVEAESYGATFCYNRTVTGSHLEGDRIHLHLFHNDHLHNWDGKSPAEPEVILIPKLVINATGLSAPALANRFQGIDPEVIPSYNFARGSYFNLSHAQVAPFKHLIYPVPEDGGLGVHFTLDLHGQFMFGPDVEWLTGIDDTSAFLNKFDYSVSADRANQFYSQIRKYYPGLKDGTLEPGYAGIRPKLAGRGHGFVDFVIQGKETHGIPGLVNLFGIESPGLTASMAIAEHFAAIYSRKNRWGF